MLQLDSTVPNFWRNSSLALDSPSIRQPGSSSTALTFKFAAHRGHVDVFRLLLKHGADWRGGRLPSWKSRFPIPGLIMTALHVCALVDNSVCLGVLIKDGADLNYQPAPMHSNNMSTFRSRHRSSWVCSIVVVMQCRHQH